MIDNDGDSAPRIWRLRGKYLMLAVLAGVASAATAQTDAVICGPLENHYGPFDYRTASQAGKALVERVHFTPKVENLRGGNTSITPGGDLNYTLRVFPNHPRALMTVMRLAEKEKTSKPRDMDYSVPCWFERAERFRPDDAMVQALYGVYLTSKGKPQEATSKLDNALALAGDNANIHYNLGLAYFDLGQFDKALESAHRAYSLGFPLPGLRDKLKRAGKWREPAASAVKPDEASSEQAPPATTGRSLP